MPFLARDSLQALSGIRIATRAAIHAGPITGKVCLMQNLKTHCKHGHLLSGDNLYINPRGDRECRSCRAKARRAARIKSQRGRIVGLPMGLRTHCKYGHPYSGENLYVTTKGGRGCRECIRALRRSKAWKEADKKRIMTEQKAREVLLALQDGKSINLITTGCVGQKRRVATRIVRWHHFRNYCEANPQYAKLAGQLRKDNARKLFVPTRSIAAPAVFRNDGADAFAAIKAATASLPDQIRDDVQSAMFLAAAEGRLKPRDAARRVREFVTAHNRQFSKFVPNGGGIMQSLDQQVYDDGPTRLVDTVTRGLWQ